jgi:hypothetical protein
MKSSDPVGGKMKSRKLTCVAALALFAAVPNALASNTWYVNGVSGSDGNNCTSPTTACKTIGHAISLASSGDSIMLAAATYKENLTIGFGLKIVGSGAKTTIIDGGGISTVVTISAANAHVALSKVTIRNGSAVSGGGILNSGTLTIGNSTLSQNSATCTARFCSSAGGGILNSGTLTIGNSTLSGNSAKGSKSPAGGGIYNSGGTLTINRSTLSQNSATCTARFCSSAGGGIYNSGSVTISQTTLSGSGAGAGGGIYSYGTLTINGSVLTGNSGSGLYNAGGTLTISNTTLSGNTGGIGAGIYTYGMLIINNSTLSSNSAGFGGSGGAVCNDGTARINKHSQWK